MINYSSILNIIKYTNSQLVCYDNKMGRCIKITPEMYEFMNIPLATKLTTLDIVKFIIEYVDVNKLQHTEDKKCIIADNKLKNLLGLSDSDKLTYFNLLKYINKHIII